MVSQPCCGQALIPIVPHSPLRLVVVARGGLLLLMGRDLLRERCEAEICRLFPG